MQDTTDRLGAATGVVASLAVGVPVLVEQVTTRGPGPVVGPVWLFWCCYLGHLAVFLVIDEERAHEAAWRDTRVLLTVMTVLGAGAYLLVPTYNWAAVLFVVTAVTAAFVASPATTGAVVLAQTVLIAVLSARMFGLGNGLLAAMVYGSFQGFGALLATSLRREAEARAALAATNAELRAATALLERTSRTAERLRIARDLHDVVGHQLTALSLALEVAAHRAEPPARDHVLRARGIAKDLLGDVRAAVGELRAPTVGLADALHAMLAELPRPRVHLDVPDELQLDDETGVALLRCVQEIVTNAIRHADAAHVWVTVRPDGDGVRLEAHDDGRGAVQITPGNGLTGMRERIEALGGAFGVDTGAGRGVRVVAEVPAR